VPTFKGYRGFPASICTSPNSMVVHGIPGSYRIDDGDLLSVDVGATLDGYVADSAYTFAVGEVPESSQRLLEAGQAALEAGSSRRARQPHRRHLRTSNERPRTPSPPSASSWPRGGAVHHRSRDPDFGEPGRGPLLQPGMTCHRADDHRGPGRRLTGDDRWSIYTRDDSLAAHFEHTVAVTDEGPRILTAAGVRV
jgi:methionyl aminopeptidase